MVRFHFLHIIIGMIVICAGVLACQSARPPETAENLYSQMTQQNVIEFYEFPQALKSIKGRYSGSIIENKRDTLRLIYSYPNLADKKNRYRMYTIGDNHGNLWTLAQEEEDKYKLYRHNSNKVVTTTADYIKAFCGGGTFPAEMVIIFSLIINSMATKKDEMVSVNSIIKMALLVFFIGGCVGISVM